MTSKIQAWLPENTVGISRNAFLPPAILLLLFLIGGCASFTPGSLDAIPFRERAQTKKADGLTVSVSVLSRDEANQLFGTQLHENGVQPVWLDITNTTNTPYWLMLHGLDPNYFSAHEVAFMSHKMFSGNANRKMDEHFSDLGINQDLPPGTTRSGFAFSNETIGTKEVRVKLFSNDDVIEIEFFVSVPGMMSEWETKDLTSIYSSEELVHLDTEEELNAAIRLLPCCTEREIGIRDGTFLNVVMVGNAAVLRALIRAGWDEAVFRNNLQSRLRPTYLYGRPPDLQFEKTRPRTGSRNFLRLWMTPLRYKGKVVSVGSIKRDTDPNIDEAMIFLLENLGMTGAVSRFGAVTGMEKVSRENPRKAFNTESYWTMGNRLVIEIVDDHVPLDELETFNWSWEGQEVFQTPAGEAQ